MAINHRINMYVSGNNETIFYRVHFVIFDSEDFINSFLISVGSFCFFNLLNLSSYEG